MKTLLFPLLALIAISCSKPENEDPVDPNAPTSFVFYNEWEGLVLENSVVGYFDAEGYCHKLVEFGDIEYNETTPEFIVEDESITEVYFFCDTYGSIRWNQIFTIQKNRKNTFRFEDKPSIDVNKEDSKQYPH